MMTYMCHPHSRIVIHTCSFCFLLTLFTRVILFINLFPLTPIILFLPIHALTVSSRLKLFLHFLYFLLINLTTIHLAILDIHYRTSACNIISLMISQTLCEMDVSLAELLNFSSPIFFIYKTEAMNIRAETKKPVYISPNLCSF